MNPRTLGIFHDYTACTLYRVITPFHYANAIQPFHWVHRDDLDRVDINAYDILMLPRFCYPDLATAEASMALFRSSGRILVYEIDDDLLHVPEHNPASGKIGSSQLSTIAYVLGQCHAAITTNDYLARVVGEHNPDVYVIPNYVDPALFRACPERRKKHTRTTIGVSGSSSHTKDWEVLEQVWPRIAARFPDVDFVVCGHAPASLVESLPPGRLTVHGWKSLEGYQEDLADIDIGCAPLVDDHFNQSKTPIKALEYALAGAAVVASPVVYARVIRDGRNGLLADTPEQWEAQIARLIERPRLRAHLRDLLRREAQTVWSIQKNADRWAGTMRTIARRYETHPPDYEKAAEAARLLAGILPKSPVTDEDI